MEKIYQVDIAINSTAYALVNAESPEEAILKAQTMLDAGRGILQLDTGGGSSTAENASEHEGADAHEMEDADKNDDEYKDALKDKEEEE